MTHSLVFPTAVCTQQPTKIFTNPETNQFFAITFIIRIKPATAGVTSRTRSGLNYLDSSITTALSHRDTIHPCSSHTIPGEAGHIRCMHGETLH